MKHKHLTFLKKVERINQIYFIYMSLKKTVGISSPYGVIVCENMEVFLTVSETWTKRPFPTLLHLTPITQNFPISISKTHSPSH